MASKEVRECVDNEYEKANQAYRLMVEETSDIVILHDPEGGIDSATSAFERVLKRTSENTDYQTLYTLIHPDDRKVFAQLHTIPQPGQMLTAIYRILHGDGHYIWLETTIRGVFDSTTGTLQNLISASRDITDRKNNELEMRAAQERAEAANKAKSRFLANMSHELRTPLNAVIGFTDLMRQRTFGPLGCERYEEYTTLIYDSAQLLLDLISDMLDMAKIEAGKLELNIERVDLNGTVSDCVRMLRDRAENNGLELNLSMPRAPVFLSADKRAVKQVLLNILANAIKFTPAGGHVGVSVRGGDDRAVITVRDTGVGISEQDLPRLGNPFEQGNSDPMLAKGGTGLGLALVRSLMEKHGGLLQIDSEEGVGTCVRLEFPLTEAKRSAA